MSSNVPRMNLLSGDRVIREDGKEFVVDERRGALTLFKAMTPDDPELFTVEDLELARLFSDARLVQRLDGARNSSPRALMAQKGARARHIPDKHKFVIDRRLAYALALRDVPRGQRSGPNLEAYLDEVAKRRGDVKRPGARVIRAWLTRLIDADYDPTVLLPHHAVPRRRERKLDPIFVEMIEWAIDNFYLNRNRWTAVRVYQELRAGLRRYVDEHPEARTRLRSFPSIGALRRAIRARDRYEVMSARYGKEAADRHFRIAKKGRVYTRPYEALIIDATKLDLMIVDEDGATRERPYLIVGTCATTRMPAGFALTIEPPSAATVLQTLRNCMAPKAYVQELYPHIRKTWPCHGKPEEIIFDVGRENFNADVPRALREFFADVTFTAVDAPQQKGLTACRKNPIGSVLVRRKCTNSVLDGLSRFFLNRPLSRFREVLGVLSLRLNSGREFVFDALDLRRPNEIPDSELDLRHEAAHWLAEERIQHTQQRAGDVADRPVADQHEIDVLGIASRRREMHLVKHGSAAHGDLLLQERVAEDQHHGAGQEQILLDLRIACPWRMRAPADDLRARDHALTSTEAFSMTSHGARRGPSAGSDGSSAQTECRCWEIHCRAAPASDLRPSRSSR